MGTLKIKGRIHMKQYWPEGKSDADTSQLQIKIDDNSFKWYKNDTGNAKNTKVFIEGVVVRGDVQQSGSSGPKKSDGKPVKNLARAQQHINVRLQGIDAPELHFKIYDPKTLGHVKKTYDIETYENFKLWNIEYRQYYSETGTIALRDFLRQYADSNDEVSCEFVTRNVNEPSDVCDIYGRFVGDIYIDNGNINVNQWIIENGHALPAYYNSMTDAEMDTLTALYMVGKTKNNTAAKNYNSTLLEFDETLVFREDAEVDPANDKGAINLPKLFRRLCVFSILDNAGVSDHNNFIDYVNSKKDDKVVHRANWAKYKNSNNNTSYEELFSSFLNNNKITEEPYDLIFTEGKSTLINPETRKRIKNF